MAEYPQPGGEQRSQQHFIIFDRFKGLNTQSSRTGLPNDQLAWLENLQPLAENKLQIVPAPLPPALTITLENIVLEFYATMNGQDWIILFTQAGGGFFYNVSTTASGQFAPDGTFSTAPDCTTWQGSRILINDSIAGYCTWDGVSLFVQQGGLSPNMQVTNGGANYAAPPPVSVLVQQSTSVVTMPTASPGVVNLAGHGFGVGLGVMFSTTGALPTQVTAGTVYFVSVVGGPNTFEIAATPGGAAINFSGTQSGTQSVGAVSAGLGTIQINVAGAFSTPAAGTQNLTIGAPPAGGTQAIATATVTGNSPNRQITSINIVDPGSGYSTPPTVTLTTTGGTAPQLTAVLGANGATVAATVGTGAQAGQVTNVNLVNPGNGFAASDVVSLQFAPTTGSGAAITVRPGTGGTQGTGGSTSGMSGSAISAVTLLSGGQAGSGSFNPGAGPGPNGSWPLDVGAPPAGGTQAVVWFTTASNPAGNFITGFVISNAGAGYTAAPTIAAQNAGAGFASIPSISATMSTQHIQGPLALGAGGTGYAPSTNIPLVFKGGGGNPQAKGFATTNASGVVTSTTLTSTGVYTLGARPTITVAAGAGASALAHVWPFVTPGTTLAVFQGRVFLGGGQLLQWSGTGASTGYNNVGYDDFLVSDLSGALQIVDADLVHAITALRSFNNYLWVVGDQSIKQIGSLFPSGAPPFQLLTLSSDQGTIWPKSCISYNRIFLFANPQGIFGVFGSTVQKISDDLDGIFQNANFAQQPQGAVFDLNSKHNAVFLVRYNDPQLGTRSLLLVFDGKRWWLGNQGNTLVAIASVPIFATDINQLWGSITSTDVTELLADPTTAQTFKISTALAHADNPVQGKRLIRAGFTADAASSGPVNMLLEADQAPGVARVLNVSPTSLLVGGSNDAANNPLTQAGIYLGATLTGTFNNFILQNVILEYQETSLWKGA